jgi:hypothetical protein
MDNEVLAILAKTIRARRGSPAPGISFLEELPLTTLLSSSQERSPRGLGKIRHSHETFDMNCEQRMRIGPQFFYGIHLRYSTASIHQFLYDMYATVALVYRASGRYVHLMHE